MRSPFEAADQVFQLEFPSRLEEREKVIAKVMRSLTAHGCRLDDYFDRLCLDECISNAILHGNGGDPKKKVAVRAFCRDDLWGVEVADEGPGFDWQSVLKRLKEGKVDDHQPSGRGIAIIRESGAEMRFFDGGRRQLIFRKSARLPPKP